MKEARDLLYRETLARVSRGDWSDTTLALREGELALGRLIPVEILEERGKFYCPCCRHPWQGELYCPGCGQALSAE